MPSLFRMFAFSLLIYLLSSQALAQSRKTKVSNAQLADPKLERRVDELLKRMTLAEKIGQLVQYSATEGPSANTAATTAALNVNPPAPGGVDSYALRVERRTRFHAQHSRAGNYRSLPARRG